MGRRQPSGAARRPPGPPSSTPVEPVEMEPEEIVDLRVHARRQGGMRSAESAPQSGSMPFSKPSRNSLA